MIRRKTITRHAATWGEIDSVAERLAVEVENTKDSNPWVVTSFQIVPFEGGFLVVANVKR